MSLREATVPDPEPRPLSTACTAGIRQAAELERNKTGSATDFGPGDIGAVANSVSVAIVAIDASPVEAVIPRQRSFLKLARDIGSAVLTQAGQCQTWEDVAVIERLSDMPPGTVGFRAAGEIEREDYDQVPAPEPRRALQAGAGLRTAVWV
jgi:hypothetical protein